MREYLQYRHEQIHETGLLDVNKRWTIVLCTVCKELIRLTLTRWVLRLKSGCNGGRDMRIILLQWHDAFVFIDTASIQCSGRHIAGYIFLTCAQVHVVGVLDENRFKYNNSQQKGTEYLFLKSGYWPTYVLTRTRWPSINCDHPSIVSRRRSFCWE